MMKEDMLRTKLTLLVILCLFIVSVSTLYIDRQMPESIISTEKPDDGKRERKQIFAVPTPLDPLKAIEESLLNPPNSKNISKLEDSQLIQSFQNTNSFTESDIRKLGRDKRNKRTSPTARRYISPNYVMKEKPSLAAEATQNDYESTFSPISSSLTPELNVSNGHMTSQFTRSTIQLQPVTDKSVLKANANPPSIDTVPNYQNKPVNAFVGGNDVYKNKKHHGKSVKESYGLVLKAEKRYDELTTEGGKVKFSEISAEVMSEMERIENAADQDATDQDGSSIRPSIMVRHRRGAKGRDKSLEVESLTKETDAPTLFDLERAEEVEAKDESDDAVIDLRAFRHIAAPRIEIT